MLLKETKQAIINEYKTHEGDTGSPEVQVAILTYRINELTQEEVFLKWLVKEEVCSSILRKLISKDTVALLQDLVSESNLYFKGKEVFPLCLFCIN